MNLKGKVKDLATFAWNDLRYATDKALRSESYADFEAAFKQVRQCERRLAAVRAQVRTHMRKTKKAMQDACPHTTKVDTRIRHSIDQGDAGRRIVEIQACAQCSKEFDLREKVS